MKEMVKKWDLMWDVYYEKVRNFSLAGKISLSVFFALLTGISAQIYIKLPFTPVPLTFQVFTVLLSGVLLGRNFAALSQFFYFIFGVSGIGWFYGSGAGILRPTNGYIIGFIFSAYFIGKFFSLKKNKTYSFLIMLCSLFIIYFFGCLYLSLFLKIGIYKTFLLGAIPFIPFDIIKAYLAAVVGNSIIRNRRIYEEI